MSDFNRQLGIYTHQLHLDDVDEYRDQGRIGQLLNLAIYTSSMHDKKLQSQGLPTMLNNNQVWVVTQYHIKNEDLNKLASKIEITTRVVQINRFFVVRYFEIISNNECIISIYAQFAAIDMNERKVVRLDLGTLKDLNLIDQEQYRRFDKISVSEGKTAYLSQTLKIQSSDIDENEHVNNGVYLKWCLEQVDALGIKQSDIQTIDIKYGKEILPNQAVSIEGYKESDKTIKYIIKNDTIQQTACSVKISMSNVEEE